MVKTFTSHLLYEVEKNEKEAEISSSENKPDFFQEPRNFVLDNILNYSKALEIKNSNNNFQFTNVLN